MTIEFYRSIIGLAAIAIVGCSTSVDAPSEPSAVSEPAPSEAVTEPAATTPPSDASTPEVSNLETLDQPETPTAQNPTPDAPTAQTPAVTAQNFNTTSSTVPIEVGYLSEIEGDVTCRQTGGILAYAETENYLVYICADVNDPTQPRYYRSFDRDGNPGLNLEATDYDPFKGRYFEFKNSQYSYLLQIPTGATPNPRLTVQFPDGEFIEEEVMRYLAK